ncbi:MAG: flagellin FliC3 [Butyrivibrio sp.]|uniref:flagellin N-terminal helical domain-containing protein n=1 Tax=Butyrivibrio sp. TaxID=28121 RepID=UPI0025E714C8|nr:flagellin [Butyrivibrio sp.]MCR5771783.1 flagellin FliC3 [Butyrivibrio sp.]
MKINYNVSALVANNALKTTDNKLTESLERLSSGLKIANAKDNPSGLAMSRRMNAQIKSLDTADDSNADGISIVETADGVLAEMQDMLQRMSELAIKASNETNTDDDRAIIDEEIQQLKSEIERVSETTEFNGQKLLDGTFDLKGYATVYDSTTSTYVTDSNITVSTYSDEIPAGTATIAGFTCKYEEDSVTGTRTIVTTVDDDGSITSPTGTLTDSEGNVYDNITVDGDIIKFSNSNGQEVQLRVDETISTYTTIQLEITGTGAMAVQIGANEGQYLDIRIPTMSLSNIGVYNANTKTLEDSNAAIEQIKNGISYISAARSRLGAYQNRLEHTNKSIDVTIENMTAAYSRIMDVDMAEEMTTYSTQTVLDQAGISMLAQANERPSEVLQLLQ